MDITVPVVLPSNPCLFRVQGLSLTCLCAAGRPARLVLTPFCGPQRPQLLVIHLP